MATKTALKPIDTVRMEEARDHIHHAIGEILLGNGGVELAATVKELYHIEDILWQYATVKGEVHEH